MGTLSVWKFDTAEGAGAAVATLEDLSKQQLITVMDAATVSWPEGAKRPKTHQLHNLAGAGALGGAFWGLLFGLLFFVPLLGMAIGAAAGALSGALTDVGINDAFMKELAGTLKPGSSALFVLVRKMTPDKVLAELQGSGGKVLKTSLSHEDETRLQAALDAAKKAG